jgi:hypothetical protein
MSNKVTKAGGGGRSTVYQYINVNSGASFTLPKVPLFIVSASARGQALYPNVANGGYSFSGAVVTTTESWAIGDILIVYTA